MMTQNRQNQILTGRVIQWHEEEGWGVIKSSELDSLAWAHFSHIDPSGHRVTSGGFRLLWPGDRVQFTVERAEQDGFHWRTTWISSTGGEQLP